MKVRIGVFPCGRKGRMEYTFDDGFDCCLHSCPINIDVNDCDYWKKQEVK